MSMLRKIGFVVGMIIAFSIPVSAQGFSDVKDTDWCYEAIESAIDNGYVNGYEDGTFKPNNYVTNGEFYKMISLAYNLDIPENNDSYWAIPYAETLSYANRNISKSEDSLKNNIKREDAIRDLLILASGITNPISTSFVKEEPFKDMPNPTVYRYDGYIMLAKDNGVIKGTTDGYLRPNDPITRAEAVAIIERALNVDTWKTRDEEILKDINIEYIGKYSNTYKNSLCSGISKLPKYMVNGFIENDGKIIVTEEDTINYYNASNVPVSGLYFPSENKLVLFTNGKPESFLFDITRTFIHEFGHYVFDEVLSPEDRTAITELFNEGNDPEILSAALSRDYCETNVGEFWAELFYGKVSGYYELSELESLEILDKYLIFDPEI